MSFPLLSAELLRQCSGNVRSRNNRRRWIALGALLAYAATGSGKPARAQSMVADAAPADGGQTTSLAVRRWNIPASSLDVAVAAWERTTNRHVQIAIPAQTLAGFRSQGATGIQADDAALRQLIAGTGLAVTPNSDGSMVISVQRDTQSVQVSDSVEPTIALERYPVPLLDTPQSITTISPELMKQEAVTTLRDALRNAPGISLAAGEGGSQGDNLTIRGFTARNDIFLDGIRDFGSYYRDSFNYEQVEVLEGPEGVAFGRGSTGGVINQESKQPELRPFIGVTTLGGTDTTRRLTTDINEPLAFLGENAGDSFRLNLMVDEGGVAERDVAFNRRYGVAPSLAFGLGTPNRLKLDYFRQQENDIPDYGIPWYFNKPAPVTRSNYYGFAHGNYLRTNVNMFTLKAEHDFAGWATLRNQFRIANSERDVRITEPQLNVPTTGTITPATPLSQVIVNRNQITAYSNEGLLWDQLDATVHTKFWGIRHVAVIGAEGGRETSDPVRPTFTYVNPAGATVNSVPTASLLSPDHDQAFAGTAFPSSNVHVTTTSYAFYLLDTMQFGRHWEFSGGARFDRFLANEKSITYPTPVMSATGSLSQGTPTIGFLSQLTRKPSWRAALIYKPTGNGSIYFAYGTSFNPSAEALSLTVGTDNISPEFNRSYEFGTKWDLMKSRLSAKAAIFRTTKDNAREPSPTNSNFDVLSGNQRVDGAEGDLTGRITAKWQVLANYTFMHSEVIQSITYPNSVGFQLANVPDNSANLWTTYQPSPKMIFGAGSNFVDRRTASSTVPLDPTTGLIKDVPSYVIFSAMGGYTFSDHISFQANVTNLTNRNFIDEIHPAHIIPGAGATGLFGLNFKF